MSSLCVSKFAIVRKKSAEIFFAHSRSFLFEKEEQYFVRVLQGANMVLGMFLTFEFADVDAEDDHCVASSFCSQHLCPSWWYC